MKGFKPNKTANEPIYIQLYEYIKQDILTGRIADGERLPSRRTLVKELGISKTTAEMAYFRLEAEGMLEAKPRSGCFARVPAVVNTEIDEPDLYLNSKIAINMSHNGTDIPSVPQKTFSRLYRETIGDMGELLGFGHKYGEKDLRKAIEKMLYSLHGFHCRADKIIIGAGTDYLLTQLATLFPQSTVFGFENACFLRSYVPVKNTGRKIELIENTLNGFEINELYEKGIDVVYVSPKGQYPTNYIMPLKKREQLIHWAEESENRYIIEADFDADFSCKNDLKSLFLTDKNEKVIYLGTFSRSIAPSVKTSYMILPSSLKNTFDKLYPFYTCLASRAEQQVLAKYILRRYYENHCNSLKAIYGGKRNLLIELIKKSDLSKIVDITNAEDGTYFIITVKKNLKEKDLTSAAAAEGVKLMPISSNRIRAINTFPPNSFLMGFGALSHEQIKTAVDKLKKAWL